MWSRLARTAAAVVFGLIPLLTPATSLPARALGEDPCPEPNDQFQAACYLGPSSDAVGFISHPGDVDAYRIEVLDFNVDVHVEMPTMPAAYKIRLANWNGQVIASSSRGPGGAEVIDTTVNIPGAYYIFVHSASGGFSDSQPYTLFRALAYPGASIPDILFTSEFREGSASAPVGDIPEATFTEAGGRYTITSKVPGTASDPHEAWFTGFGPELTDFTMTIDARLLNDVDAGFSIFFRHTRNDTTYKLGVDVRDGQAKLLRVLNGDVVGTDWKSSSAIDRRGGVNRVVIRCFESDIKVNINGEDIFDVTDSALRKGRIGVGTIGFGAPPSVSFDNIVITTPTEG